MRDRVEVPKSLTDLGGTFQEDPTLRLAGNSQAAEAPLAEEGGVYADVVETAVCAGDGRCMAGLRGEPISNCFEFDWPCVSQNGRQKSIAKQGIKRIPVATVNGVPLATYLAGKTGEK
ncbi:MAG: hypothetical protein PHC97_02890 [Patescibacteria group bacterium]|nr:hypothetical protein [Patescibacteria group bacterium]